MASQKDEIQRLSEKLDFLKTQQNRFNDQIQRLSADINRLKPRFEVEQDAVEQDAVEPAVSAASPVDIVEAPAVKTYDQINRELQERLLASERSTAARPKSIEKTPKVSGISEIAAARRAKAVKPKRTKNDLEKFIGENLINKIGIAITVIGVVIGAKYAIDHEMVSPLTRIILGYLTGLGLLAVAFKLKKDYLNFSAVLLSGAMAILYFITFAAFSFYELLPQSAAFALMLCFTAFTVFASLQYNLQVIAHFGLVGAYAIPFFLSTNSGSFEILFGYMLIINLGIILLSFKRDWKSLYYAAFGISWIIFLSWFSSRYDASEHLLLGLLFLVLFYITFYITFLSYKLVKKETFSLVDVIMVLANSFLFFGIGYAMINMSQDGALYLGLFTVFNALLNFVAAYLINKQKSADKNLFYLILALVLTFITIAVPVQLDGQWVTLVWSTEAALLIWLGRSRGITIYEQLAYPLLFLSFFSLLQDWSQFSALDPFNLSEEGINPVFNKYFLNSFLFFLTTGFSFFWMTKKSTSEKAALDAANFKTLKWFIGGILVLVAYNAMRMEVWMFWEQKFMLSNLNFNDEYDTNNYSLKSFGIIWQILYSILYFSSLQLLNLVLLKHKPLGSVLMIANVAAILVFLAIGLYQISELRESYLDLESQNYYIRGAYYLYIRYIAALILAYALISQRFCLKAAYMQGFGRKGFELFMHLTILWFASSELLHHLSLNNAANSYKLALSILNGSYSLFLVSWGIAKNKSYVRISAMILFGLVLIKLFVYDLRHLDTISKTVVLMSLGILLLIISFLYNKYKSRISDDPET